MAPLHDLTPMIEDLLAAPEEYAAGRPLPHPLAVALRRLRPPPREPTPRFVLPVPVDPAGILGPTRGQARGPRWRRTGPNRFVPTEAEVDQPAQRIAEAAAYLPDFGGVTGWAALHLAGAPYFTGTAPDGAPRPVGLQVGPLRGRRNAPGVEVRRETIGWHEFVDQHGIRCLEPERALFDDMLRRPSLRLAVVDLDMAMHAELTSLTRFADYVARHPGKTNIDQVRAALALAVEGAESPMEVLMGLIWVIDAQLARPLHNPRVFSTDGRFLGRVDLLDAEAGVIGEYDGGHHLNLTERRRDVGREELLRRHGLEYFTVVAGEVSDRQLLAERMLETRRRALHARHPRRWTLTPPDGVPDLTLDQRLLLRPLLDRMRDPGAPEVA